MAETLITQFSIQQDKKSKHDFAYQKLKEWIIQGTLPADTILVERQFCEALGLSRTPIRSALQELAREGFVLMAPGRGMMVSRVQIEDVIEIFEIRKSLDILALKLFMKSCKPHMVAHMREIVDQMQDTVNREDFTGFIQADNLFHEFYYHHAGNLRLQKIWMDLSDQERRILTLTIDDLERCQKSFYDHRRIMERIEEGDVEQAAELLGRHLEDAQEYHIRKIARI